MKDGYTHITLVVDRSGSMESIADDAQGGINTFVSEQKAVDGEATFYLCEFDTEHGEVFGPADIQRFEGYVLAPRGGTALYDAIGRAITKTGRYLKGMAEADRPSKVVFCIVTDGHENSSVEWSGTRVRDAITDHQDRYSWQFVFIGANIDAYATGDYLGVHNSTQYVASAASTRKVYSNLSATTTAYRGGAAGMAVASVDVDGNDITESPTNEESNA